MLGTDALRPLVTTACVIAMLLTNGCGRDDQGKAEPKGIAASPADASAVSAEEEERNILAVAQPGPGPGNPPEGPELSKIEGVSIRRVSTADGYICMLDVFQNEDGTVRGEAKASTVADLIERWHPEPSWIVVEPDVTSDRFNVRVEAPDADALWPRTKRAMEQTLGIRITDEKKPTKVFVIQKAQEVPEGLVKVEARSSNWGTARTPGGFGYKMRAATMQDLAKIAVEYVNVPVLDETGLEGFYSFTLSMDDWKPETLFPGVQKLGLRLLRTKRELAIVHVTKAEGETPDTPPPSRESPD